VRPLRGRQQGPADHRHGVHVGLKKSGDEYTGGQILDPDIGKVYKSKLTLAEGGKKVSVRGYIGMPLPGRSQVWVRQE
jgi:uncharacterized protein (DUF2147 family)